jgi:hypothetical protein
VGIPSHNVYFVGEKMKTAREYDLAAPAENPEKKKKLMTIEKIKVVEKMLCNEKNVS